METLRKNVIKSLICTLRKNVAKWPAIRIILQSKYIYQNVEDIKEDKYNG
ncbi:hypothetical protein CLOSTHATH_03072 [Hungatella hathewayi DSM 13479]|uniref:Uncharacterized protein n=1 Tax=Hungatella hathewayi DSM 13479 TaxID=566550 RepID=D3AHI4_9FIRM|nr:hypothetical protein CLOSTHATH_03072 [Hungatella hathewayi DSM 13479]